MKITAYLIQNIGVSYDDLLNEDEDYQLFDKTEEMGFRVCIVLGAYKEKEPEWLGLIKNVIKGEVPIEYQNKSTRAVVFVGIDDYFIAYALGHGRHLLNDNYIIRDFGIKIALNSIDPNKLKGMDKLFISENMLQQRFQSSKTTNVNEFPIDKDRDFLKAVSGETLNGIISKRLHGSDSIQFNMSLEFEGLYQLSVNLLTSYQNDSYKTHFSWFDNIRIEKSKNRISELDELLVNSLEKKADVYLVAPEIVDDLYIDQISFTENGDLVEFEIDAVLEFFREKMIDLDIETLKKRYIFVNSTGGKYDRRWKIYNCLLAEVNYNGDLYSLMMGTWFKVDNDFKDSVQRYISTIPISAVHLPKANHGELEKDYSIRVATLRDDIILLDQKLIDNIEVCDLLTNAKQFIHIKPWKSSSTLSHLFSQGRISSTLLLQDKQFRVKVKNLICSIDRSFDLIEVDNIDASSYEIVFALIYKENKAVVDRIPLFSKINLMQSAQIMLGMGFKVTLKHIEIN